MRFGQRSPGGTTGYAAPPAGSKTTVTVDGSSVAQTIDGFGVSVNSGAWHGGTVAPWLTNLVQEMGASIVRVVVEEMDAFSNGGTPYTSTFSSTTQYTNLWNTIGALNTAGLTSGVTISCMGQGPPWMGQPLGTSTATKNAWADAITQLVNYGLNTAGVQFGHIAPTNEPDLNQYEGVQMSPWSMYADCLNRLATQLDSMSISRSLKISGSETYDILGGAQTGFTAMQGQTTLMTRVSYGTAHNYGTSWGGFPAWIAGQGFNWWQTEVADFDQALTAVDNGASAVLRWDYVDSIYNHATRRGDAGLGNDIFPGYPSLVSWDGSTTYARRSDYYKWCHLCRHIRPGSQKIGLSTSGTITGRAFKHTANNTVTVVGSNSGGSSVTMAVQLANLSRPQWLSMYVTDGTHNFAKQADVRPANDGVFYVTAPANCTFTLTNSA